jgi:hypothetical protein
MAGARLAGLAGTIAAAVAIGLAAGYGLRPPAPVPAPRAAAEPASIHADLEALREALAEERAARARLNTQLAELRRSIEALQDAPAAARPAALLPAAEVAEAAEAANPPPEPGWFDEASLVESGVRSDEASRLREYFEEIELERLYLLDQAKREGWFGSPRFRQTNQELVARMIEDLGEDGYDRLLYGSGQHNRVKVVDVLKDSPASHAGLRQGDYIVRYAGERIYQGRTLTDATASGAPGASTAVDIERGNEELRVYVPRGPLGVRIEAARHLPAPRW